MKGKMRHDFFYRTLWALLHKFFACKFNFKYDKIKNIQVPFIIIANHVTNYDPILIGISLGRNTYFVATDQIFRMGFKSKLIEFLFSPIPRAKTINETQTVITIFKRLKDKCNICIFAEGNATFDGDSGEILPSIGKLVKRSGATLVTYRFTGAYFTSPRWSRFIRRGKTEGRLVQIYDPEEIASMRENEIYEAIKKDIYVSAYADQEKNPVVFRGKRRAEYLETALYCCPRCKQFAALKSDDDVLSCICGFQVRYNELCYFETPQGDSPPFKTITDWANWQKKEIDTLVKNFNNMDINVPIFSDDNQQLFEIERASRNIFIAEGKLCLYKDRLSIISAESKIINFPIDSINDMSGFARTRIIFSTNERKLFEIHSKHPRSALKYLDIFNSIKKIKELS